MRRGILVVVAALATLAGCRDFQVPPLGYHGPLKVDPAALTVAPEETATLHIEGGSPPYTLSGLGPSGSGYASFPLSAKGSGGWADLATDGTTIDYQAGDNPQATGAGATDPIVVRDHAGATVQVKVTIGPPLSLTLGGGGPISVRPGGTLLAAGAGGKGPYLFGLEGDASGGVVDAVTGRYRAGPTGCVTDTLLVRDAVPVTATKEVNVQCAALPGSPTDVVAVALADPLKTGTDHFFYLTTHGPYGGQLEIPVYGGTARTIDLPGTPLDIAALRGSHYLLVTVDETVPAAQAGIHVLAIEPTAPTPTIIYDLFDTGSPVYPVPKGTRVELVTDGAMRQSNSTVAEIAWTIGNVRYVTPIDPDTWTTPVLPSPVTAGPASVDGVVTFAAPTLTGTPQVLQVVGDPSQPGTVAVLGISPAVGWVVLGRAMLGMRFVDAAAATIGGPNGGEALAVLGNDASGNAVLSIVGVNLTTGVVAGNGTSVTLEPGVIPTAVAGGLLESRVRGDILLLGSQGRVFRVNPRSPGPKAELTSFFLPPGTRHLLVTDVDGDGLSELVASGDPAGGRAVYANPSSLPHLSAPNRGIYGTGQLDALGVGPRPFRVRGMAVLAADRALLADGSKAPTTGDATGGELMIDPGGEDLGDPIALKIPVKGYVTEAVSARLQPPPGKLPADPADVVAVVQAVGGAEVWEMLSDRPGVFDKPQPVKLKTAVPAGNPIHLAVVTNPLAPGAPETVLVIAPDAIYPLAYASATKKVTLGGPLPGITGPLGVPGVWTPSPDADIAILQGGASVQSPERLLRVGFVKGQLTVSQGATYPAADLPIGVAHIATLALPSGKGIYLVSGDGSGISLVPPAGTGAACVLDLPGTVDADAFARATSDGSGIFFTLDETDDLVTELRIDGVGPAVVAAREPVPGTPKSLVAGDIVGGDLAPDAVVGGTPLEAFAGVPNAYGGARELVNCQ